MLYSRTLFFKETLKKNYPDLSHSLHKTPDPASLHSPNFHHCFSACVGIRPCSPHRPLSLPSAPARSLRWRRGQPVALETTGAGPRGGTTSS